MILVTPALRWVRARVARRFFLVFILCAFVPLAALSLLSLFQVRGLLAQQGEQRLAATAKSYGMTVFERLLVAGDVALAAREKGISVNEGSALVSRTFDALDLIDGQGTRVTLLGDATFAPASAAELERLRSGKLVMRVIQGPVRPSMQLLTPVAMMPNAYIAGELRTEYVWGPADELPAATDFCVMEDARRLVVYCSRAMPAAAFDGRSQWEDGDERFIAQSWTQFMRAALGTADWVVIAAQPERVQLRRAADFARNFVPIVLLALLLVLWLTIRQSRDISVPVARLAERARGVAGSDFSSSVDLKRDDELGSLAVAFDQMSHELGRQFTMLNALAEIDRLILSTQDTTQVIETVLKRLHEATGADATSVLLLDQEATDHARSYTLDPAGGVQMTRHEMGPMDRSALASLNGTTARMDDVVPSFLEDAQARGMKSAFVQPVVWRGTPCGAIVLAYAGAAPPDEPTRQSTRELGDRIAVAVSSAWRDQQIYQQSHFDTVTGAPNRLLFRDRLALEVVRSQREGLRFALLFIDLDHFKNVNDSYGHSIGDAVLREAAARISRCTRASDSLARLGGDEFTVLLPHINNAQEAWLIAETVVSSLSEEFVIGDQRFFLSASVGIASFPDDGTTEEALLKSADTAMYRAKAAGRAQAVFYEERMNEEAMARMALDRDLRAAIERGELELHYQPQRALQTGALVGAEALVRWTHPVRGPIPPAQFIPLAEESGYIEALGQWILREASRQLSAWREAGLIVPRVAVNVSPRQFRRRGFIEYVARCVEIAGIPPESLEIEVTEGLLMDRSEAIEAQLRQLAQRGHPIALDDFGTGFSSMAYLKRFPVHSVKIDRVFIVELEKAADSAAIVEAIVAMAHALDKQVIAEGVETEGQAAILRRLGCDAMQGFLWAKPMSANDFANFVRKPVRLGAEDVPLFG